MEEGKSISRLWVANRQMRVGSAVVTLGGIAGVGTDRNYRNRGLSRQVLDASLILMQREGYDASFLYGIQDFYHKFGFITCMPQHSLELNTVAAERAEKSLKMRAGKKTDMPQIARLYNRENARLTAYFPRPFTRSRCPNSSRPLPPALQRRRTTAGRAKSTTARRKFSCRV